MSKSAPVRLQGSEKMPIVNVGVTGLLLGHRESSVTLYLTSTLRIRANGMVNAMPERRLRTIQRVKTEIASYSFYITQTRELKPFPSDEAERTH